MWKKAVHPAEEGFVLDRRLAADTVHVCDMPLSRVLLIEDARFPWLVLVPRRASVVELIDLDEADYAALMGEVRRAGEVLRLLLAPDKLNIAALGNVVAQLHVHVIARLRDDVAWPKPVWGSGEPVPYESHPRERLLSELRRLFR